MLLFLAVFVVSYLYHGLGITLGYHRLLAHRAVKVPESSRFPGDNLDRHGRNFLYHVGRGQALDRSRSEGVGGQ